MQRSVSLSHCADFRLYRFFVLQEILAFENLIQSMENYDEFCWKSNGQCKAWVAVSRSRGLLASCDLCQAPQSLTNLFFHPVWPGCRGSDWPWLHMLFSVALLLFFFFFIFLRMPFGTRPGQTDMNDLELQDINATLRMMARRALANMS